MLKERFVSHVAAQALKDAGFTQFCDYWYDEHGELHRHNNFSTYNDPVFREDTCCHAPTQQMAVDFLMIEKGIIINVIHVPASKYTVAETDVNVEGHGHASGVTDEYELGNTEDCINAAILMALHQRRELMC